MMRFINDFQRLMQTDRSVASQLPVMIIVGMMILGLTSVSTAQDRVYLKQSTPLQGSISNLTPLEVTISVRGKDQTVPMRDVRKIAFDKEPPGLDRARDLVNEGKYQQALDQLRNVSREAMTDLPRVRQDYEFYSWFSEGMRSLAGAGDSSAAIRGLTNLDKVNPNSHHRFAIKMILGRLAVERKFYDRAIEYFTDALQSSDDGQRSAASIYLARVHLDQGKFDEARERLKGLLNASATSAEISRFKSLAAVMQSRIEIAEGRPEEALKALDGLAEREDNADFQLFAEINNARGAAYQKMNDPRRAAYSYLQTDLLFFTEPETHAEALFYLKTLLVTIGQPAKAAEAGSRLTSLYASSNWANR
jgi:predicted negative regulator of RcsB-dependent stress response